MPHRLRRFPYLATVLIAGLIARLFFGGLSAWGLAAFVVAALWFAVEIVRWLLHPVKEAPASAPAQESAHESASQDPLVSLVFFLGESRETDESAIRRCLSSALGVRFRPNDPDCETFVAGFIPPDESGREGEVRHFMVRIPEGLFAVLVSDRPYIDDPKEFARTSIRDKRLRTVVERHRAWISVDRMEEGGDVAEIRRSYRVIGRILAAMAGPDCLAIYCPELQRCNEFDPGLLELLRGADPLRLFDEPTFEPVIEVSENDPDMAAAVREAVTRWPEFVAAFAAAPPSERDRFIAKAEFKEGRRSEYMWVAVVEIHDSHFRGVLMNDPHELLEVHRGATVEVALDRLNDWIHPGPGGGRVGGFTLDVLGAEDEEE